MVFNEINHTCILIKLLKIKIKMYETARSSYNIQPDFNSGNLIITIHHW